MGLAPKAERAVVSDGVSAVEEEHPGSAQRARIRFAFGQPGERTVAGSAQSAGCGKAVRCKPGSGKVGVSTEPGGPRGRPLGAAPGWRPDGKGPSRRLQTSPTGGGRVALRQGLRSRDVRRPRARLQANWAAEAADLAAAVAFPGAPFPALPARLHRLFSPPPGPI